MSSNDIRALVTLAVPSNVAPSASVKSAYLPHFADKETRLKETERLTLSSTAKK